jgi:hypothetical protein
MQPDLHKRHYFIDQYKNKYTTFSDDRVIVYNSEDNLQTEEFTSQSMAKNFGMQMSTEKSETMSFLG